MVDQPAEDVAAVISAAGWGPTDPSALTTAALIREIDNVKAIIKREVAHHEETVNKQFETLDRLQTSEGAYRTREMEALHKTLDERYATQSTAINTALSARKTEVEIALVQMERLVNSVVDTMHEKFRSVEVALNVVERQRVEQKADTAAAVDAALIAQKEAVREQTTASGLSIAKSEAATDKRLEQQAVTVATAFQGVSAALDDAKGRIARIESAQAAMIQAQVTTAANKVESRAVSGDRRGIQSNAVGLVGGAIGFVLFLFVIIDRLTGVAPT